MTTTKCQRCNGAYDDLTDFRSDQAARQRLHRSRFWASVRTPCLAGGERGVWTTNTVSVVWRTKPMACTLRHRKRSCARAWENQPWPAATTAYYYTYTAWDVDPSAGRAAGIHAVQTLRRILACDQLLEARTVRRIGEQRLVPRRPRTRIRRVSKCRCSIHVGDRRRAAAAESRMVQSAHGSADIGRRTEKRHSHAGAAGQVGRCSVSLARQSGALIGGRSESIREQTLGLLSARQLGNTADRWNKCSQTRIKS